MGSKLGVLAWAMREDLLMLGLVVAATSLGGCGLMASEDSNSESGGGASGEHGGAAGSAHACDDDPCQNDQSCLEHSGHPICGCDAGLFGDRCELRTIVISMGNYHGCALREDGTLACWGLNDYGQATPPEGTFTAVAAGSLHSCGIRTDGTLACWGSYD